MSENIDKTTASAAIADMRIEIVKRELNQGALAGFDSSVTDYAARLVVAALDSFDEEALKAEFRRGFEAGEVNAALLHEEERQRLREDYDLAHADRLQRSLERDRVIDEREHLKTEVEQLLDALRRMRDTWYRRPGWTDAADTVDALVDTFTESPQPEDVTQ